MHNPCFNFSSFQYSVTILFQDGVTFVCRGCKADATYSQIWLTADHISQSEKTRHHLIMTNLHHHIICTFCNEFEGKKQQSGSSRPAIFYFTLSYPKYKCCLWEHEAIILIIARESTVSLLLLKSAYATEWKKQSEAYCI